MLQIDNHEEKALSVIIPYLLQYIAARGISLPSHPTLTDDVILEVVSAVRAALSEA